jgi:hypothetical protein
VILAATAGALFARPGPDATPIVSAQPYLWPESVDASPPDGTTGVTRPYNPGNKLLDLISRAVPEGWTKPLSLRVHQAEADGKGVTYFASAAVTKNGRTGRLMAEVHTPGTAIPDINPCSLADLFWNMHGDCQIVTVGSAKVGVVYHAWGDEVIDQWAAHRYSDGTVVYIAQSRNAVNSASNLPPLTDLPLTVQQLAALAADPKFHLS